MVYFMCPEFYPFPANLACGLDGLAVYFFNAYAVSLNRLI